MTRHMIEVNFHKATAQADALEEEAQQLRTLANSQMDSTMQDLRANWTGDAASAYLEKCETMRQNLLLTARQLVSCAQALRRSARRLYDAEMTALRIAEERAARA